MSVLDDFLREHNGMAAEARSMVFDLSQPHDQESLAQLVRDQQVKFVRDDYGEQLKEYYAVTTPSFAHALEFSQRAAEFTATPEREVPLWQQGRWAYYPWLSTLVHVLDDEEFQSVRTARNRNLITQEEQKKFYDAVIGVAGLSVGNSAALAIVLQGGGRRMRLADSDTLALSNLNRIRAGVPSLGLSKTDITARQIYELNPYANLELFSEGLTDNTIARFFSGPPQLDVIVDEIDDLVTKCRIREYAKKLKIPLVSAADVADNGVVFVERYDKDPELEPFLGFLGYASPEELKQLDRRGAGEKIAKLLGMQHHTARMLDSLKEIGKSIVSWPQLGGAALLNGAAVAYCVRKIVTGELLESGRYFISLDEKFAFQEIRV